MKIYQPPADWKRPRLDEIQPGVRARIQHCWDASGPSPEIVMVEGTIQLRGKKQKIFVSDDERLSFDITATTMIEIEKKSGA